MEGEEGFVCTGNSPRTICEHICEVEKCCSVMLWLKRREHKCAVQEAGGGCGVCVCVCVCGGGGGGGDGGGDGGGEGEIECGCFFNFFFFFFFFTILQHKSASLIVKLVFKDVQVLHNKQTLKNKQF